MLQLQQPSTYVFKNFLFQSNKTCISLPSSVVTVGGLEVKWRKWSRMWGGAGFVWACVQPFGLQPCFFIICVCVCVCGCLWMRFVCTSWETAVCKSFLIPSLQSAETLLGPTEGEPLSGYRSVQQHAVVLVHSKNTYIHT